MDKSIQYATAVDEYYSMQEGNLGVLKQMTQKQVMLSTENRRWFELKQGPATCDKIHESGDYYANWNKQDKEKTLYDVSSTCR